MIILLLVLLLLLLLSKYSDRGAPVGRLVVGGWLLSIQPKECQWPLPSLTIAVYHRYHPTVEHRSAGLQQPLLPVVKHTEEVRDTHRTHRQDPPFLQIRWFCWSAAQYQLSRWSFSSKTYYRLVNTDHGYMYYRLSNNCRLILIVYIVFKKDTRLQLSSIAAYIFVWIVLSERVVVWQLSYENGGNMGESA